MEEQWLTYAKRLQAIASTGLHFVPSDHDRERYVEIEEIAQSMLSKIGNVPIKRIEQLIKPFAEGYATPKVDVRGAVIEDNKILLVREKTDGLWALPGGFADIGLSPAQNVEREINEEAGLNVNARFLYSVRHKAKQIDEPDIRDFYKILFICERIDGARPTGGHETSDARFFRRDQLPDLSRGRTIEGDIESAYLFIEGNDLKTLFD